jgi:adenosylhomocysteine nucleosidase
MGFFIDSGKIPLVMKPIVLIAYAVAEEYVDVSHPSVDFVYCQTGVGKVNATLAVLNSIDKVRPSMVVNLATAGSVAHPIGSIHLCAKFVDRDMAKLSAFGVCADVDFSSDVQLISMLGHNHPTSVCNTGDTFLTSSDGTGDVFDMEAFAMAKACQSRNVPFVSIKFVTDIIGQNSVSDWAHKLADARIGLKQYMEELFLPQLKL